MRDQLKEFANLFNFTVRGIEEHLEHDRIDADAITDALQLLDTNLQRLVHEEG